MAEAKTRFAVLRGGSRWEGIATVALESEPDGVLRLARAPALPAGDEVDLAAPYDLGASGLAVGSCSDLYLADTDGNRVLFVDGSCDHRLAIPGGPGAPADPGQFVRPRGLAVVSGNLVVADEGNARLQLFRLPSLELRAIVEAGLVAPTGLADAGEGRLLVLDRGPLRVRRFQPWGEADPTYDLAWSAAAAALGCSSPAFLALDQDRLHVSDDAASAIFVFDGAGAAVEILPTTGAPAGFAPRALAARGDRLYVADAAGGRIWIFSLAARAYLGAVPGYRGPVTALAIGSDGTLHVKPDLGEEVLALDPAAGFVAAGTLLAGPLDAGLPENDASGWNRIALDVEVPAGASASAAVFVSDSPTPAPQASDYLPLPSLDALVPLIPAAGTVPAHRPRFLWLQLSLASTDGRASPALQQVQVETGGEEYVQFLPAVFSRRDPTGFLRRMLELFRSLAGELEWTLDSVPRRLERVLAPDDELAWLASWVAFEPPDDMSAADLRALMTRIPALQRRRGTSSGLAELVALYAGVRPHIVEPWQLRSTWVLGERSVLGIDTMLAPAQPDGIILPDPRVLAGPNHGGCEDRPVVVGQVVVGASGPQEEAAFGEPLFQDDAHRFVVFVPASAAPDPVRREALRDALEAEKPAHTDYHLCFIEPAMRVGQQATIGIDSIVGGPAPPSPLDGAHLGVDSTLADEAGETRSGRIGMRARLGSETVLG